jgi:hypothetical protein
MWLILLLTSQRPRTFVILSGIFFPLKSIHYHTFLASMTSEGIQARVSHSTDDRTQQRRDVQLPKLDSLQPF